VGQEGRLAGMLKNTEGCVISGARDAVLLAVVTQMHEKGQPDHTSRGKYAVSDDCQYILRVYKSLTNLSQLILLISL